MAQKLKLSYDKKHDMFSVFVKGGKYEHSFEISLPKGDILIDYDFNGKVIGLEFFNASEYFKGIEMININSIEPKLSVKYGKEWAEIEFSLSSPELEKNLSNIIISPYKFRASLSS